MGPQLRFQEVSPAELRAVEGGLSWSGFWDALVGAASWLGDHISLGFKDFAGAAAGIIRYGFQF